MNISLLTTLQFWLIRFSQLSLINVSFITFLKLFCFADHEQVFSSRQARPFSELKVLIFLRNLMAIKMSKPKPYNATKSGNAITCRPLVLVKIKAFVNFQLIKSADLKYRFH